MENLQFLLSGFSVLFTGQNILIACLAVCFHEHVGPSAEIPGCPGGRLSRISGWHQRGRCEGRVPASEGH